MFAETTKAIVEILKLAPRYLAALCLVSGVLLFVPETWISGLGLVSFVASYRTWIGLVFLVSTCICVVSLSIALIDSVKGAWRSRAIRNYVVTKLNALTEDEKQILRFYFAKNTRANSLRVDDGVVQELVSSRIIYRSAQIGDMVEGFAHNITDFAWDYVHANPSVLLGKTNTYRTDKRDNDW